VGVGGREGSLHDIQVYSLVLVLRGPRAREPEVDYAHLTAAAPGHTTSIAAAANAAGACCGGDHAPTKRVLKCPEHEVAGREVAVDNATVVELADGPSHRPRDQHPGLPVNAAGAHHRGRRGHGRRRRCATTTTTTTTTAAAAAATTTTTAAAAAATAATDAFAAASAVACPVRAAVLGRSGGAGGPLQARDEVLIRGRKEVPQRLLDRGPGHALHKQAVPLRVHQKQDRHVHTTAPRLDETARLPQEPVRRELAVERWVAVPFGEALLGHGRQAPDGADPHLSLCSLTQELPPCPRWDRG